MTWKVWISKCWAMRWPGIALAIWSRWSPWCKPGAARYARPPGALLAVRGDGMVSGSVPGGCVEDDLIARVKSGERSQRPGMIAYGVSQDEAARFKDAVHDGMGDSIAAGTPRPRRLPG